MEKLQASRISGGNTAYARVKSDFYPTPPEATIALMDFLRLPEKTLIWEPASGEGHMANAMRTLGYSVIESDIQQGTDFLDCPLFECDWIITNPPFSLSEQFILRCHKHKRPFALLLKSQYWHAKRRLALFAETRPAYILPLTWRPDFCFGQRGGGSPLMDVMWVVWDMNVKHRYPVYIPLEKPKAAEQMAAVERMEEK